MGFTKKSLVNRAADSVPASAPAPAPERQPSSPGTLSFFSRFSLPLRSRARHIADFHIRPAEPHRKYGAGDQVQGAVILTVVKPVRITHLVVSLHGYMRVYKGPNVPANEPTVDPADVPTITSRSSRQKPLGNGCVRLFQDEQTLSADGRLEPGRYEFNFNLLFPADGLPSSIDFERGTISYLITATLTRPTSLGTKSSPKTSCERKVYLAEKVDVGPLTPPRARTIYLEPISRRSKRKKTPAAAGGAGAVAAIGADKSSLAVDTVVSASDSDPNRANENSTEGSLSVIGEDRGHDFPGNNPRSPVQSDVRSISGESAISASTGRSKGGDANNQLAATTSLRGKRAPTVKDRTITANVELLKGGCLPGDMVPIKISVQHIRRIKSMHGIIVTLYRLGRIDSSPALLAKELPEDEARRLEKDQYYPRSKTGLGGLSLSAAGTCSVFRKDLSQAFAPLIIDPDTLSTSLTASVRVPEDVFPTIQGVPYEMISFKYQVEVIVDLGGKLANQIQTSKPTGPRVSATGGPLGMTGSSFDGNATSLTSWGTSIIDTDRLRRQKGVICVVFEVVVGTTDSSRTRGKGPMMPSPSVYTVPVRDPELQDGETGETQPWPASQGNNGYAPDDYPQEYSPSPVLEPPQPYSSWDHPSPQPPPVPHYIPPPNIPDETALSDKERIRRAEQRLLPSQPPDSPLAGPSTAHLTNTENIYDADDQIQSSVPPHNPEPHPNGPEPLDQPSAPTLEDLSPGPGPASHTEDKQELERRRLLAEASAPPEFPDDYDHNGGEGPSSSAGAQPHAPPPPPPPLPPTAPELEPSAPALDEDDEVYYGPQFSYSAVAGPSSQSPAAPVEQLPRYER